MGVPPEWRKFLFTWLSGRAASRGGVATAAAIEAATSACGFFEQLPASRRTEGFDVVILDAMQELALIKHGENYRSGDAIGDRVKDTCLKHLLTRSDTPPMEDIGTVPCTEVVTQRLLIVCFDNQYCVPRNKSFKETMRDQDRNGGNENNNTDAREDNEPKDVILNSASFATVLIRAAKERAEMHRMDNGHLDHGEATKQQQQTLEDFDPLKHFIITHHAFPADGAQVWRNSALSWQLKRVVTESLCELPVPEGKHILIDEGMLMDEQYYANLVSQMLKDHGYDDGHHSTFEKVSLIGNLMKPCFQRILLKSGKEPQRMPSTGLGESDHKIPYYVQRTLPLGMVRKGSKASYLVKCQDTDVLWMLLLHASSLINPVTGNIDDVDVWLDTQTPADRANGISRPYRFVNIVTVWRELIRALKEEFPTLKNPLESFIALVFCNNNDYVEAFAPQLKLGPATIWNFFAQNLADTAGNGTYPSFSTPGKRDKVSPAFPRELRGKLNDWVITTTEPAASLGTPVTHRVLALRSKPALVFFYGLIQRSPLVTGMAKQFKDQTQWARDSMPYESNHEALLESIAELSQLAANNATTKDYTAPLLFVPTVESMKARLARINWTIDYYFNGWKSVAYETNWFENNGEYSRNGWSAVDVTGSPEGSPVSQYLYAQYQTPKRKGTVDAPNYPCYRFLKPCISFEVGTLPY